MLTRLHCLHLNVTDQFELRRFQRDWRNILDDNDFSEDADDLCEHTDVATLIEALQKMHPEHARIPETEAALRAVLAQKPCASSHTQRKHAHQHHRRQRHSHHIDSTTAPTPLIKAIQRKHQNSSSKSLGQLTGRPWSRVRRSSGVCGRHRCPCTHRDVGSRATDQHADRQ